MFLMESKSITIKLPKLNYWAILSFILLVVLVFVLFGNIKPTGSFLVVSKEDVGKKVIDFINSNLVSPGTSASLAEVKDIGSVYEIITEYQGQKIPVYATKDGKMLFLQGLNLTTTQANTQTTQTSNQQQIPKREIPDVKLFVMSYCPFGLQAEKALLPVMKLLDGKANITIHFVYYCMHGDKEVYENLRQYCIQSEQKDKFYDYLLCFVQSGDYNKCLDEAKVDKVKLESCMNLTDEKFNITNQLKDKSTWLSGMFPKFDIDLELNKKYNVQGSPTLVINDQVVSINRSPESFKQAICSAFINPPSECNQQLSTATASPGIGPLTGSSSSSSGSCG